METIILVVHVLLSLAIIGLVMLQRGKGAEAGAALGGGGGGASGSVFGASGAANFLSRSTAILATAFFASSLSLAYLASHRDVADAAGSSVIKTETVIEQGEPAPMSDVPSADPASTLSSDVPAADPASAPSSDVPAAE
ncbi:MAG: preprotein translocase subunit SecG [Gammaproteobacteria bacterium]|nr:preprotein translocase subunit SecG [Gammaproteobacteria bacterium]